MKIRRFTLIEVVVAMAVLGLALVGFFAMSNAAVQRIDRAYSHWERMHLLSQAAEYYLLFTDEEPPYPPPEIFDSNVYELEMRYEDVEDLPEDLVDLEGQAPLQTLVIELVDADTKDVVDSLRVDRIYYDADGESVE